MLASILLSLVTTAYAPQDTIHVGELTLTPPLSVGADTVDNYVTRDGERRLAVVFIQTITETDEGYLVVQENRGSSGAAFSLDSILVSGGSLAPRWHGDVTPQGSRHVAFTDGRMTGMAVDSLGRESAVDVELPPGLFDYSLLTLVADRLPLSVGYEATIAAYDITRGPVFVPLRVVAEEAVTLGGESSDAWRMEVELGGQTVTRWVERATRRELKWRLSFEGREMTGERRLP